MKALFDLHTHTVASGHAFSTWNENVRSAKAHGLLAVGISEHAPMMPGSCHEFHFSNSKVLPKYYEDMRIYNGVEANIMDYKGTIDVLPSFIEKVDYIIASLHKVCIEPGTSTENTNAYLEVMKNPYVKIIGHPDDSRYPIDYEELTIAAAENHICLELNNSSMHPLSARKNGRENILKLLTKCKEHGTMIIMGTDSHYDGQIGLFEESYKILEEVDFPEEQIINTSLENLKLVLNRDL